MSAASQGRFEPIQDAHPADIIPPPMVWPPPAAQLTGSVVELSLCFPFLRRNGRTFDSASSREWRHRNREPSLRLTRPYTDPFGHARERASFGPGKAYDWVDRACDGYCVLGG